MARPADLQREQWTRTFATRPDFLGADPSDPGRGALERFQAIGARSVLELGPGQGRDTLAFATGGLSVTALDFAEPGLAEIAAKALLAGLSERVTTIVGDVRDPLPFEDATFDAGYAHMLLCMALTTGQIAALVAEVRRVIRPGGLFVYTVRTTADSHYGAGIDHGDDRWEMGGFIVHFFGRDLVDRLAIEWDLLEVSDHTEGRLPRRLWAVTLRRR